MAETSRRSQPPRRATLAKRLRGKRVLVCVGAGGVGKTTTSASLALGLRVARSEGRGRHDRPGTATRVRSGPGGAAVGSAAHRAGAVRRPGPGGRRRAVGDDARCEADLRRADHEPGARRRHARGNPRQRRVRGALDGGRRFARAQRDLQALRTQRGARLRRDRARHAAVTERAGLSRRLPDACSVSSKAGRYRCSSLRAG